MDIPQDHSSRAPKIRLFLFILVILLIPFMIIKISLLLSSKNQLPLPDSPATNTLVSVTPYLTQQPLTQSPSEAAKPAPPLTQATLDDWSKKLASGSEADFRSVVELPQNQQIPSGAITMLASLSPFQFKLETFKKNSDNTTGSIALEIGSANKKKTVHVSLKTINGAWKIVNIKM